MPFEYENSFVTINALSQNNLYLIGITDNAALRATSSQIYQSVFWVSGLTLLALTACIVFFSRRLSLPIEKLTNRMRHMEGIDSGVVIEHKRNCDNEIEDMNWYFSQMVKQVNISFEDLKQSEEQKRELQLSLLQDQIKPHFLYNALDAIYVMEFMEQRKEAMEATKALADFYRSALSDGEKRNCYYWAGNYNEHRLLLNDSKLSSFQYFSVFYTGYQTYFILTQFLNLLCSRLLKMRFTMGCVKKVKEEPYIWWEMKKKIIFISQFQMMA